MVNSGRACGVVRLHAAQEQPLHVLVAVANRVRLLVPKLMRLAKAVDTSSPGTVLLQVLRVGDIEVLPHADLLRQAPEARESGRNAA